MTKRADFDQKDVTEKKKKPELTPPLKKNLVFWVVNSGFRIPVSYS